MRPSGRCDRGCAAAGNRRRAREWRVEFQKPMHLERFVQQMPYTSYNSEISIYCLHLCRFGLEVFATTEVDFFDSGFTNPKNAEGRRRCWA